MWPFELSYNPMAPLFEEKKRIAANIPAPCESGDYTAEMFAEDFPEFYTAELSQETGENVYTSMLPASILDGIITRANASVLPSRWGADWRHAAGLFVAHFAALRLQTYKPGGDPASVAASATNVGTMKSASLGDTSISYDNAAVNAGTEKWGAWNLTTYGTQLATMARLIGMAGMYAI